MSEKLAALVKKARLATIDPMTERTYTQEGLGQAVGMSGKTIAALETSEVHSVNPELANALSRVTGVTVASLCRAMGYNIESNQLSRNEDEVLQFFRRTPPHFRRALIETIRGAVQGFLSIRDELAGVPPGEPYPPASRGDRGES